MVYSGAQEYLIPRLCVEDVQTSGLVNKQAFNSQINP